MNKMYFFPLEHSEYNGDCDHSKRKVMILVVLSYKYKITLNE